MKTFLRLLAFLRPFSLLVALAALLGCVMIASNMGLLSMAAYLIAAASLAPLLVALVLPMYIVRFMSITRVTSRYLERLLSHNVTFRLLAQLRAWVYSRLEPLAPGGLFALRSGDVLARLITDIEELQNFYLRAVSPFVIALVIAALTFFLLSIFSPLLAWTAVAFLFAAGLGVPLLAQALSRGLGRQQLALRAELNTAIVDGIQGVQDLLAYGHAGQHLRGITELDSALTRVQRRMARITGLQQALNDGLMNMALWVILILAIPLVTAKAIGGVYMAFLTLLILASFEAVQPLAQALQSLGHSLAAGERLFALTDASPLVKELVAPLPAPEGNHDAGHTLEFDHVYFAYQSNESEVLHDITFCLRPGSRVAIVGPSGAGKSTIVRLALRFWDPTSGSIRLDGQDLRQYSLDTLRDMISVVAQDTYLFNDTIRENLLLARSDASDEDISQALEQAQLGAFVQEIPDGLDTWIGEQGLRLSGGERQRLAIARALLKNARLLILDEATANLDPLTEHALLDALAVLMRGRTTLVITHRLVLMERMDEILVLDQKGISERGTHEQLLAANGLYRQMFDIQNGILTF